MALANNCHELTTLECSGMSHFSDTGFQAIAKNCIHLERMDLEECVLITDTTLAMLSASCPLLESLSLSHCELITDEGIRHLGMAPCASETLNILELGPNSHKASLLALWIFRFLNGVFVFISRQSYNKNPEICILTVA
jgi:hypothetical protein